MNPLERYELIVELHRNGGTHQQIADRFGLTAQRVGQILAGGPPETNRHRGKPCPQCEGSSEVKRVYQGEVGYRQRECLTCHYVWFTEEVDRSGKPDVWRKKRKDTGNVDSV